MNIDEAKNYVLAIARKNQIGVIPTSQLNVYFQRAQVELVSELRSAYEWTSLISDQLAPLVSSVELFNRDGKFYKPENYMYWVSIYGFNYTNVSCGDVTKDWVEVKLITQDKLGYVNTSSIVKPSAEYPVAINFGNYYSIYPSPSKITLTYVRTPKSPVWGYDIVADRPVYNELKSTQLELPDSLHLSICSKVLGYMGISTRDAELVQGASIL